MRHELIIHPDTRSAAADRITIDVERPRPGELVLRYAVTGDMDKLLLPALERPERADALWQHTCFEIFIRPPGREDYFEFNFAPSTRWAAYRLAGYRRAMRPIEEVKPPFIDLRHDDRRCEAQVRLDLDAITDLPKDTPWRLGLTTVIEDTDGTKSYWALAHPQGKPDFHREECFALDLPQAEQT